MASMTELDANVKVNISLSVHAVDTKLYYLLQNYTQEVNVVKVEGVGFIGLRVYRVMLE